MTIYAGCGHRLSADKSKYLTLGRAGLGLIQHRALIVHEWAPVKVLADGHRGAGGDFKFGDLRFEINTGEIPNIQHRTPNIQWMEFEGQTFSSGDASNSKWGQRLIHFTAKNAEGKGQRLKNLRLIVALRWLD